MNTQKVLKEKVKAYHRTTLLLRRTISTKKACHDKGYIPYYPHINNTISFYLIRCKRLKGEIFTLKKELKDHKLFEMGAQ